MRIARLAITRFYIAFRADEKVSLPMPSGRVPVRLLHRKVTDSYIDLFWSVEVRLDESLTPTSDGQLRVPTDARRRAESRLEEIADAVAVSRQCRRTLRSPVNCVYIVAESSDESAWLSQYKGIAETPVAFPSQSQHLPPEVITRLLSDRRDGVSLLAEALSQDHATGQFHEYFRLFERAFRLDCEKLIGPLASFLNDKTMGYDRSEIENWVKTRGPATHADRRATFLLEADTRPFIHRMQQAAYEVLCNKKKWRDRSSEHRDLWTPVCGTSSTDSGIFMTRGKAASLTFNTLDSFGIYPRDLTCDLQSIPGNWWPAKRCKASNHAHH